MKRPTAIIIGAGPAGLTAAYELATRSDIVPIVLEKTADIGGISKTVNFKGNRIDIGGHRFFSKSDKVMKWWDRILPLQGAPAFDDRILRRDLPFSEKDNAPDPEVEDRVMLIRNRLSRIFFLKKFFDYPLSLNPETIRNLGIGRVARIGTSYVKARLFPRTDETTLEDFFINRFGGELYRTFFEDYTQKVWGVPCREIKAEWGAQRVKGLSISKAIAEAVRNVLFPSSTIEQKKAETSLIKMFLYPKYGPGQLWEAVAGEIVNRGGKVYLEHDVTGISCDGNRVTEVKAQDRSNGSEKSFRCEYAFSTMPLRDLILGMEPAPPPDVASVARGLRYRDFMTAGLLLKRLKIENASGIRTINDIIPDNWIYVQDRHVKLGRIQIFNNWSPYMVKDRDTVWLGLEYFCHEGDELWGMEDEKFLDMALSEIEDLGLVDRDDFIDGTVIRVPKTYPAYFGSYDDIDVVRDYTDTITNLFLIGRNGMHRYNNQDHSMLTAMVAVDCILKECDSKTPIWSVNEESEYHES